MAASLAAISEYDHIESKGSVDQSRAMKLISFLIFAVFVSATIASAHSPYFGQREKVELPEFGEVEFAILFGDGIIFADPSQVIVFDSEGHLLAATPLSDALIIRCNSSHNAQSCSVYDVVRGLVYKPDFDHWGRRRTIVENGRPSGDAYPEYINISYGFIERRATFADKLSFEVAGIAHAPGSTLFAIFWWCLALAPMARLFWCWRANDWKIKPVQFSGVLKVLLSVTTFLGMTCLAVFSLLYVPYSILFFVFVFTLGGMLAFVITRPWGKRAANQSP
ncbi:hypothetical protein [Shimia marina]|uniref:Uncharacterized protein n=1 Tax=Shimia marina TaxID=321267 RepID=A0A0P1EUB0_9RHOB|nr:hypothetical protein [Shimia marina]CUH54031.1 hypothetical protein SHM7688_03500 [Shimia marina]SFE16382.1 hypothetical protein SAMN04488037_10611 [Shimia marina]